MLQDPMYHQEVREVLPEGVQAEISRALSCLSQLRLFMKTTSGVGTQIFSKLLCYSFIFVSFCPSSKSLNISDQSLIYVLTLLYPFTQTRTDIL